MDDRERAHHAQLLLDNPVFKETLEEVSKGISREMEAIKPNDKDSAMSLVMMRQAASRITNFIAQTAEGGRVAEFNAKPRKRGMFG